VRHFQEKNGQEAGRNGRIDYSNEFGASSVATTSKRKSKNSKMVNREEEEEKLLEN
jgi:hypothetical protein